MIELMVQEVRGCLPSQVREMCVKMFVCCHSGLVCERHCSGYIDMCRRWGVLAFSGA